MKRTLQLLLSLCILCSLCSQSSISRKFVNIESRFIPGELSTYLELNSLSLSLHPKNKEESVLEGTFVFKVRKTVRGERGMLLEYRLIDIKGKRICEDKEIDPKKCADAFKRMQNGAQTVKIVLSEEGNTQDLTKFLKRVHAVEFTDSEFE